MFFKKKKAKEKKAEENKIDSFSKIITFVVVVYIAFSAIENNPNLSKDILKKDLAQITKEQSKTSLNEKEEKTNLQNTKKAFNHEVVSPQDFKNKLESGKYILIDLRTQEEYVNEKIAIALNIDFDKDDFREELSKLDKNKKYLYYSHTNRKSSLATYIFKELGFADVYELENGIKAWKEAGFETEK